MASIVEIPLMKEMKPFIVYNLYYGWWRLTNARENSISMLIIDMGILVAAL